MPNTLRVRHHRSPAERAEVLALYRGGGLTQKEVAAQYDIAVATLQRWLHTPQESQDHRRGQLIEVPNLLETQGSDRPYRLLFPQGLVLELTPGFQAELVRTLAQLLQSL
jgi:transposase-like protein